MDRLTLLANQSYYGFAEQLVAIGWARKCECFLSIQQLEELRQERKRQKKEKQVIRLTEELKKKRSQMETCEKCRGSGFLLLEG